MRNETVKIYQSPKKKRNLKVLLLSPFFKPNVGGAETHLDDLCKYMKKMGHDIYVITYQPLTIKVRAKKKEKLNGLEIRRISWFGFEIFYKLESYPILEFIYLGPMLLLYSLLFMLKRKRNVDAIHGHGMNGIFVAAILGRIFRVRCVGSLHTIYRLENRPSLAKFFKVILSRLDSILVPSGQAKIELTSIGINSRKIRVFRYWVDQSIFRPLNKAICKSKLGLSDDFVALFVGRLIDSKGVRLVLKAASKLREATFLFVGDGPLRDEVKMAALTMKNVIFLGKISNESLPLHYTAADVLVWGNPDADYIGRVTIEALSCGLPAIAPNEVSLFGVTKKVSTEFNCPPILTLIEPDPISLVQKLKSLLTNSKELRSLVPACRSYAVEHFSDKNADVILRSYLPLDD